MFTTLHAEYAAARSDSRAASVVEYRADRAPRTRPSVVARLRSALRSPARPVVAVPAEA